MLAQDPEARVHIQGYGIHWGQLENWVTQRGYPSYRVLLTDYDPEHGIDKWEQYAISRVGKIYRVEGGLVERDPIWTPP